MTTPHALAVLDDWQGVAEASADWNRLRARGWQVDILRDPLPDPAAALAPYAVLVPTRERTAFPAAFLERLPNLRLLALTGRPFGTLDLAAARARGIAVSQTGGDLVGAATAELALGLLIATARHLPAGFAAMASGGWQGGVPMGTVLSGRTLGLLGLGRIGARMAAAGRALGMRVVAWSANLTDEAAAAAGAVRVDKAALFAEADAVSLHLVLSDRTRGIVGAGEIAAMRTGAILVNTARAGLVDEAPLLDALRAGRIRAGLDVYGTEPLPPDHPLRTLAGVALSPHLGFSAEAIFAQFYGEALANVEAWAGGRPLPNPA